MGLGGGCLRLCFLVVVACVVVVVVVVVEVVVDLTVVEGIGPN